MRASSTLEGRFAQIHVDAARNATDDFNPFHDPHHWQRIVANPFPGPLVLGFQLEALIEYLWQTHPACDEDAAWAAAHGLHWTNWDLSFAGALCPGEAFTAEVRAAARRETPEPGLSRRLLIRKADSLVLAGWLRQSAEALYEPGLSCAPFPGPLRAQPDRCQRGPWFLKRKFASVGHAKNFLAGALADQALWFDELAPRSVFPQTYAAALLSCALLEQATAAGHDFCAEPLVYTAHHLSILAPAVAGLRSNDALHLLVHGPELLAAGSGLGIGIEQTRYAGLVYAGTPERLLLRGELLLAPLSAITGG